MLTAFDSIDVNYIRRKARRIELQAGRSSPTLAAQLRLLAAQYYAAAQALDIETTQGAASWRALQTDPRRFDGAGGRSAGIDPKRGLEQGP
jgi:hypothetical protein